MSKTGVTYVLRDLDGTEPEGPGSSPGAAIGWKILLEGLYYLRYDLPAAWQLPGDVPGPSGEVLSDPV